MRFVFKTLPPSINHLYGRTARGVYMRPEAATAKEEIGWEARAQYRGAPLSGELKVSLSLYWPDRRKHDIDNGLKFLLDALSGILWVDDGQVVDLQVTKHYDRENPRLELSVDAITA